MNPEEEKQALVPSAVGMNDFDESRYSRDHHPGCNGLRLARDVAGAQFRSLLFSPHSCFVSSLCFCSWLGSCFTVNENTEAILLYYGVYAGVVDQPGLHCSTPCGRDVRTISKKKQVVLVPLSKVADANGNPLDVSAVVTFYFENPIRAALATQGPVEFVRSQATAVLKQVVSRYPYEERSGHHDEHNLKNESALISNEAVELLQQRASFAGARILSFAFNDLSYSAEVASGMLKRQQAQALIEARTTIVRGAVAIADSAVKELEKRGVTMSSEEKQLTLANLMSVIVGDSTDNVHH